MVPFLTSGGALVLQRAQVLNHQRTTSYAILALDGARLG
jgi:hypothetical protein